MAGPYTVTATLNDTGSAALQGNSFVRFRLRGFTGNVPRVAGTAVVAETQIDAFPNGSGVVSQQVWGDTDLTPSSTFYTVEFFNQGRITSSGNYIFNGNTNLNTAAPINTPPTPPGFSLVLEHNGALNSSQSTLNLVNTDGSIAITDLGSGNIQLAGTAPFSGNGAYFFGPGITSVGEISSLTWTAVPANAVAGVVAANQVVVYKFVLLAAYTISKITTECGDSVAVQTASFGIYNAAGNKLVDGGSFTTLVGTGIQTNSITPVTLPAGTYWHAQASTYGGGSIHYPGVAISGGSVNVNYVFPIWVKNATRAATAANPLVAGVLPATLGALTPFTPGASDGIVAPLYE